MSSSISSSEQRPARWRGFALAFALAAAGLVGALYAFVAVIDPWDALPLSPPLPRVPISGNARFSFPALARAPRFDAAVFGTSTSRLLQPAQLGPLFGARFANLAMNSATAWEQAQLLRVFLRAHPEPRAILIGLDAVWCAGIAERLTLRPFPAWMYGENPWAGYRDMLTPYAVQEAANQLAVMLGWKTPPYGLDGYTSFVPPDSEYDPARVAAAFDRWAKPDPTPAAPHDIHPLPGLGLLPPALAMIPKSTHVILYFPPISVEQQGLPGSRAAAGWAACKAAVTGIAKQAGAEVLDFMIRSDLTSSQANYWDPLHYRQAVAAQVVVLLAHPDGSDVRVLLDGLNEARADR